MHTMDRAISRAVRSQESRVMRIGFITGVVGVAVVAISPLPASAEVLTVACSFESGSEGVERDVNQAVFDTARPQVDLRVAQTMGTNLQVDYTFENNATRNDSIHLVANGPMIAVAAIRFGHAMSISFDRITGRLNWVFADVSKSFRYRCRR